MPISAKIWEDRFLIEGSLSRVVIRESEATRLSTLSVEDILNFSMSPKIRLAALSLRCDFLSEYLVEWD